MTYLGLSLDAYDKLLDKEPKIIQMNVCDFVVYLRKKGLASASVSAYVGAVNKFYAMNDIILNWKKIRSFMGEHEKTVEDRPYTHSEIQTLLQHASPRNKSAILIMSSLQRIVVRNKLSCVLILYAFETSDQYLQLTSFQVTPSYSVTR